METPELLRITAWFALSIPLLHAGAAAAPGGRTERGWRLGEVSSLAGVVAGVLLFACASIGGPGSFLPASPILPGIRVDALTGVMLTLVSFLGWVILRYSARYLAGEPGRPRYLRWLLLTLAAVSLLVVANNLLVAVVAWFATSLALHQLLVFYGGRPGAIVAAHQKFLLSRAAELCLMGALWLIHAALGTLDLDAIYAQTAAQGVPDGVKHALLLVACAAILKCAQLPFHGWLIKVMEAPTPVSALLHAGIVNIGGFMLIRLAPVLAAADAARTLLVVTGTFTAAVAALCMIAQPSVKTRLAWSTCAQMGYMLLECGLGLPALALLHLVGHSLYKAHAFLRAAGAVDAHQTAALVAADDRAPGPALAALASLAIVAGIGHCFGPMEWTPLVLAGIAFAPLIAAGTARRLAARCVLAAVLAGIYFLWHAALGTLFPAASTPLSLLAIAGAGLVALLVVSTALVRFREAPVVRRAWFHLRAGLHLDALFLRLTFRVWPPGRTSGPQRPNPEPIRYAKEHTT